MRYGARRDKNEPPIVEALRRVGCLVQLLDGRDIPDLLVGFRGVWWLLEVKGEAGPKGGTDKRNLRPGQERFKREADAMGLPVRVVRTPQEAIDVLTKET